MVFRAVMIGLAVSASLATFSVSADAAKKCGSGAVFSAEKGKCVRVPRGS